MERTALIGGLHLLVGSMPWWIVACEGYCEKRVYYWNLEEGEEAELRLPVVALGEQRKGGWSFSLKWLRHTAASNVLTLARNGRVLLSISSRHIHRSIESEPDHWQGDFEDETMATNPMFLPSKFQP